MRPLARGLWQGMRACGHDRERGVGHPQRPFRIGSDGGARRGAEAPGATQAGSAEGSGRRQEVVGHPHPAARVGRTEEEGAPYGGQMATNRGRLRPPD